jgi:hypothetical protein
MALHLPVCICNMRRELHASLLATDTTPTAGGSTRARISPRLAEELFQRSVCRSADVRLHGAEEEKVKTAANLRSEFVDGLSTSLHWHVSKAYTFRQKSHINLQRLRALAIESKDWTRPTRRHAGNRVQIALCDSTVTTGAVSKGRSSSFKNNRI